MDCEAPGGPKVVPGPRDWDCAKRAIDSFDAELREMGFKATFFVCPDALKHLNRDLQALSRGGAEVGVLCHPQLSGYRTYLGAYGYETQREIVHLARQTWEDRMGQAPGSFRPGFFSANDYTFQILCAERFQQGSCSLPGRIDQDQYSTWSNSYPFAHHTDPLDRKIPGTMELYEIPVTSDFEAFESMSSETYTPPHCRIEDPNIHDHAAALVDRHLDKMAKEPPSALTITFVTRSSVAWGEDDDPHIERLRNLVRLLENAAERRKLRLSGETPQSLHEKVDARLGVGKRRPGG